MAVRKVSAGILLYRKIGNAVEVLLGHPGGPLFEGCLYWTIPKGETHKGEDLFETALRETKEETGILVPRDLCTYLGVKTVHKTKRVHIWFAEYSAEPDMSQHSMFQMEWPKGSGMKQTFPELDKVCWIPLERAQKIIFEKQKPFLDLLIERIVVL